jgi:biotin transporter BioY
MSTKTLIKILFLVAVICAVAFYADLDVLFSDAPMPTDLRVLGWIVAATCFTAAWGCVAAVIKLTRGGE